MRANGKSNSSNRSKDEPAKDQTIKPNLGPWLIAAFVVPCCLVYLPLWPEWIGRIIACFTFPLLCSVIFLFYGIHPRMDRYTEEDTHKYSEKALQRWTIAGKTISIGFSLLFVYLLSNVARDTVDIIKGKPIPKASGEVRSMSTLWGIWVFYQSITFNGDPDRKVHTLFFSFEPRIDSGEYVEFTYLPHSSLILEVTRHDE